LPDPEVRAERERARFRLHLVRHRSALKQRVHAVLLAHGKPCPVSDLFGVSGRTLLNRMALPQPWAATVDASLRLIDELDREIDACERALRRLGADHPYVPLLLTVPGIGRVLAYTIAAEIGDIARFASPSKLAGYSGLCPRVYQSGESDRRGSLAKQGPKYLGWALVEAAVHASTHPVYRDQTVAVLYPTFDGRSPAHSPLGIEDPQRVSCAQERHSCDLQFDSTTACPLDTCTCLGLLCS
jgi:transposase